LGVCVKIQEGLAEFNTALGTGAAYTPNKKIRQRVPTRIEGDIPVDLDVADGQEFLFISRDQRLFTHSIHKYPAKFFPELPRWIIQRYSKTGDVILDPFMGSGTTNLEAMLLGRESVGVDVDPFSRLLAKVKTTILPAASLKRAQADMEHYLDSYSPNKKIKALPIFPYRDNWFSHSALHEMAFIKEGIASIKASRNIKEFLLICFSSIVRQSSQADNNCTRTVIRKKFNKQVAEGYPIRIFKKRLAESVRGMLELRETKLDFARVEIPQSSSATNLKRYADNSFALALTSPPYVNAVDYPRTHQLEMYWLGLANGSLREVKRAHVGTEVVKAHEYASLSQTGIESADEILESIYKIDKRRAFIASKYILDMVKNMQEVYRVLKPNGHYVIVVGSNSIRGHLFENWRYLRDAAPALGFDVECRFVSKIINHFSKVPRNQRIDEDHILVLRK